MATVKVAFVGSHGMDLDEVEVTVRNPDNCEREVLTAITRANWVMSVGDRIEIRGPEGRAG